MLRDLAAGRASDAPKGWHATASSHPTSKMNLPRSLKALEKPSTLASSSFGPEYNFRAQMERRNKERTYIFIVIFWICVLKSGGDTRDFNHRISVVRAFKDVWFSVHNFLYEGLQGEIKYQAIMHTFP
jgi:hypothetical protein